MSTLGLEKLARLVRELVITFGARNEYADSLCKMAANFVAKNNCGVVFLFVSYPWYLGILTQQYRPLMMYYDYKPFMLLYSYIFIKTILEVPQSDKRALCIRIRYNRFTFT